VTAGRDPLEGIELVVFDKDGTLIDFHLMWREWVDGLADGLARATRGRPGRGALYGLMGVDLETGAIHPHGLLAATPMSRIRTEVGVLLARSGLSAGDAETALAAAWHAPDPVALARPLADLRAIFGRLDGDGIAIGVATSDDRVPTERTLDALGVADLVDAIVCADDGIRVKPAPDAVLRLCRELGVEPARTAVVGDSPADLRMGRAARVGRVVGVLTGVGDERALAPFADLIVDSIADLARPG
jgi:phosphoglycolate phosphatase-like HAD superfamily hydrolase